MTYPTKSVRELGPQYHAGSLPQNMKGLGQCWARDGSTKKCRVGLACIVWNVQAGRLLGIHPGTDVPDYII